MPTLTAPDHTLALSSSNAAPTPLAQAFAHSDYRHNRPLLDSLDYGFTSVEADVHLVDGELLIAHDAEDVRSGLTLRSLYLDRLRERVNQNGGHVYPQGPQFILLIDVKTEAESTYHVIRDVLGEYKDILTTFGPDGQQDGPVVALISGNRTRQTMKSERVRYAAYDGRLEDLNSGAPATFIPLISDEWPAYFTWAGEGPIPEEERRRLIEIVETTHMEGRCVRFFWAEYDEPLPSPQREAIWAELLAAGVDQISTDALAGLQRFLLERNR